MPMPSEAAVGIRFHTVGMEDTLQQIARLQETLGSLGMIPANPYNPALTRQPAERGTFAQDSTLPSGAPSQASAGFTGFYPVPSQAGGTASGQLQIATAQIVIQTAQITIQTAQVQFGAGVGGGGAPALGAPGAPGAPGGSGSNVVPPTPAQPNPGSGGGGGSGRAFANAAVGSSSDAGLQRYMDLLQSGQINSSFQDWQQHQFTLYNQATGGNPGPTASFSHFLNTGQTGPGMIDSYLQHALGGMPGLGSLGSGTAFQDIRSGFRSGGFVGGFNAFSDAVGPLGMGFAGASLGNMIGRGAGAALMPTLAGRDMSSEDRTAAFLSPFAGIPIIGAGFSAAMEAIRARGQAQDLAQSTSLSAIRNIPAAAYEAEGYRSAASFTHSLPFAEFLGMANTVTGAAPFTSVGELSTYGDALSRLRPGARGPAISALSGALSQRQGRSGMIGTVLGNQALSAPQIRQMAADALASGDVQGYSSLNTVMRSLFPGEEINTAVGLGGVDDIFRTGVSARYQQQAGATAAAAIQPELGYATSTEFYGSHTAGLYAGLRGGLEQERGGLVRQRDLLTGLQERLGADPERAADIARMTAQISGLTGQIFNTVLGELHQKLRDEFNLAGVGGRMTAPFLQAAGALGIEPSPFAQALRRGSLQAEIQSAQHSADVSRQQGDFQGEQHWRETAAQLQAQALTLPLREIQERFGPAEQRAGAAASMASSRVSLGQLQGQGGAELYGDQMGSVAASEQRLRVEQERLRSMEQVLPARSALLDQQRAQVDQAQLGVAQSRTGLAEIALPLSLQERRESADYTVRVLRSVPGAYGNLRGALSGRLGALEEEAAYLQQEAARRDPDLTDAGRQQIRRRLREIGLEQAEGFQELSTGWESRMISRVIGAPGNVNLEAHGMSQMAAVMAGVRNPHFGLRPGDLPFFLRQASLVDLPQIPGVRGLPGEGMGTFGPLDLTMPGGRVRSGGAGNLTSRDARVPGGHFQMGGDGVLRIEITVRDQAGKVMAEKKVTAGDINAGLTGGGLEDLLRSLGVMTPSSQ